MSNQQRHLLVDYGRRTFVFGLPWFTVNDIEGETAKAVALETIKRSYLTYDLILLREEFSPQFSLSEKSKGLKNGTISAAAIIANSMDSDSWLYVLEIEDHIWITYGKDSLILADGDMIYDDIEEAKAAFIDLEPAKWKTVFVPASWKQEGMFSEDRQKFLASNQIQVSDPLDVFDSQVEKWMKFAPQSPLSSLVKLGLTIGLLAVVAYSSKSVLFPEDTAPTQPNLAATTALLAERARAEQANAYKNFDENRPWNSLPDANEFLQECIKAMHQMPAVAAGYQTNELHCEGNSVSAILLKGDNTYASWLQEWADNNPHIDIDIARDGQQAYVVRDIPGIKPRGDEDLKNYSYVSSVLMESSAIEGSMLTVSDPVTYTYDDYPDYIPLYGKSEISVETKRPNAWISTFSKVGGVHISSATLDPATMTYIFKGQIYVSNR